MRSSRRNRLLTATPAGCCELPHLDAHSGRRLRLCLREASLLFKTVGSGWGGRWGAGDIRWAVRGLSREIQRRSDAPPRFGRQRAAADAAAGCLPFNRLWLHPACSHILTALALSSAEQCRGHPDACACYKAAVASPSGCGDGQGAQRTPKWRGKNRKSVCTGERTSGRRVKWSIAWEEYVTRGGKQDEMMLLGLHSQHLQCLMRRGDK